MKFLLVILFVLTTLFGGFVDGLNRRYKYNRELCPQVKAMRNYQIQDMMGFWYVVQYYASSEESSEYSCMKGIFAITNKMEITMNFTYIYTDDPNQELLLGNITWMIPDSKVLSHWQHIEKSYKDVYNTYVIDTDYKNWALIMHCAEKQKNPRYLSAFMLSKTPNLGVNVKIPPDTTGMKYVLGMKDKLPRYDIDVSFMFDVPQDECTPRKEATESITEDSKPIEKDDNSSNDVE